MNNELSAEEIINEANTQNPEITKATSDKVLDFLNSDLNKDLLSTAATARLTDEILRVHLEIQETHEN